MLTAAMGYAHIRHDEPRDGFATLTLARPAKLNALSGEMIDELVDALEKVAASEARALLLTGEGRGFCSGADLSPEGAIPDDLGEELDRRYNPLIGALFDLPIPAVAAVNGPAVGAGVSLALACDIVLAARSAYFQLGFIGIGLVPDAGATWFLPRLVGRARALEMMMLGDQIDAVRAMEWGLIARVADDAALMDEARALAARLARGPTKALGLIRQLARRSAELPLGEALAAEREAQREAGRSEDFKVGIMAFLTRREPRFTGR
ncbi:MAG: enoyl-CoA hydratase-related protein [Sphingomonadaceae bacterium]